MHLHEFYILHYVKMFLKTSYLWEVWKNVQICTSYTQLEILASSFTYYINIFNTLFKIIIKREIDLKYVLIYNNSPTNAQSCIYTLILHQKIKNPYLSRSLSDLYQGVPTLDYPVWNIK
jgi:hypothetical protein